VTPSAVIQPKPGIGDVMWHLPFIRAIAAASPGGKVAFLAPAASGARELLAAEPSVAETIYFEHFGSELQRAINLIRLAGILRRCRFRTVWVLDRTARPAVAALLAGVPERIGVGLTRQRWFITNKGIDQSHYHDHPIEWLRELLATMNIPLPADEPALAVSGETLRAIDRKFESYRRPWIVLGIGAAHPDRDWTTPCWAEFIAGLRRCASGTVFLIGGKAQLARAQALIDGSSGTAAVNACDLELGEALALLRHADLFIGTDSGPMNMAARVDTPAFAMFGFNKPLTYSKFIHTIVPEGGPSPDGMRRISPAQVLEQVRPYLSLRKTMMSGRDEFA
jgi:heptosyltransferase II